MMSGPDAPAASRWTIRSQPEDFVVVEEPLYPASGEGGHTFLCVEKRGRTTEQVARELARAAGVAPRDVGYAGRKDRHAVTRQWFSLEGLDPERALEFELADARVIEARAHGHKLRTGQLRSNRFEIVLRCDGEVDDSLETIRERAEGLVRRGLPNRFGEQRFGRAGDNAERARPLLEGGRGPRDRREARFLISALQSELFNAVLADRIDAIDEVEEGDLARVEESGGLFWVDDPVLDTARARAFEISATGPIFGTKVRAPRGVAAAREERILAAHGLPDPSTWKLPRGIRAKGTRRPLRVRPEGLEVEALGDGTGICVRCALPPGSYVTVLLDELVGEVIDASRVKRFTDESETALVPSGD